MLTVRPSHLTMQETLTMAARYSLARSSGTSNTSIDYPFATMRESYTSAELTSLWGVRLSYWDCILPPKN